MYIFSYSIRIEVVMKEWVEETIDEYGPLYRLRPEGKTDSVYKELEIDAEEIGLHEFAFKLFDLSQKRLYKHFNGREIDDD